MSKLEEIAQAEEKKLELAEQCLEEDAQLFDEYLKVIHPEIFLSFLQISKTYIVPRTIVYLKVFVLFCIQHTSDSDLLISSFSLLINSFICHYFNNIISGYFFLQENDKNSVEAIKAYAASLNVPALNFSSNSF